MLRKPIAHVRDILQQPVIVSAVEWKKSTEEKQVQPIVHRLVGHKELRGRLHGNHRTIYEWTMQDNSI